MYGYGYPQQQQQQQPMYYQQGGQPMMYQQQQPGMQMYQQQQPAMQMYQQQPMYQQQQPVMFQQPGVSVSYSAAQTPAPAPTPAAKVEIPTSIAAPPGSKFKPSPFGKLQIRLICAKNLEAKDKGGTSDPFVNFLQGENCATSLVIAKNLNPVWNQTFELEVGKQQTDFLVMEVYDKDRFGADLLGFVGIDLALLPKDKEVVTTERLTNAKSGEVQIGLKAVGFGLENIPATYPVQYQLYRSNLTPAPLTKEKTKKSKDPKPAGPFMGKNAPSGYKVDKTGELTKKSSKSIMGVLEYAFTANDGLEALGLPSLG